MENLNTVAKLAEKERCERTIDQIPHPRSKARLSLKCLNKVCWERRKRKNTILEKCLFIYLHFIWYELYYQTTAETEAKPRQRVLAGRASSSHPLSKGPIYSTKLHHVRNYLDPIRKKEIKEQLWCTYRIFMLHQKVHFILIDTRGWMQRLCPAGRGSRRKCCINSLATQTPLNTTGTNTTSL